LAEGDALEVNMKKVKRATIVTRNEADHLHREEELLVNQKKEPKKPSENVRLGTNRK